MEKLPAEIFNYILNYHSTDKFSLQYCSLVHRNWTVPAQRLLFRSVKRTFDYMSRHIDRYISFLTEAESHQSPIPSYIHYFSFSVCIIYTHQLISLLSHLPKLKGLGMYDVELIGGTVILNDIPVQLSLEYFRLMDTTADDNTNWGYSEVMSLFQHVGKFDIGAVHYTPDPECESEHKVTVDTLCVREGRVEHFGVVDLESVRRCIVEVGDVSDVQLIREVAKVTEISHLGIDILSRIPISLESVASHLASTPLDNLDITHLELRARHPSLTPKTSSSTSGMLNFWSSYRPFIFASPSLTNLHLMMHFSSSDPMDEVDSGSDSENQLNAELPVIPWNPREVIDRLDWHVLRITLQPLRWLRTLSVDFKHDFSDSEEAEGLRVAIQDKFREVTSKEVQLDVFTSRSLGRDGDEGWVEDRWRLDFMDLYPWVI
ncbi:hypothetical protein K474DRAFT_1698978 [Panus rudis PR-1116 ss-1]|nr:hypothetical protein K474DRAFT_1698978 [Panus rudis PR-1116 ss-1]